MSLYFSYSVYSDKKLTNQRNIINVFAIFVVIFAGFILYLVDNPDFQRPPETDLEHVALTE
jgi:hypothetical protein